MIYEFLMPSESGKKPRWEVYRNDDAPQKHKHLGRIELTGVKFHFIEMVDVVNEADRAEVQKKLDQLNCVGIPIVSKERFSRR